MCYPLPGPRCSPSAAARLARAKHEAYAYFQHSRVLRGEPNWDAFEQLAAAREEAQREYDITPAGIKALQRQASEAGEPEGEYAPLVNARAQRASRLAALKLSDRGDFHEAQPGEEHQSAPTPVRYARADLSEAEAVLPHLKASDAQIEMLLQESEAWVTRLDAAEIEALHWYSTSGYDEVNGGLSDPSWETREAFGGGRRKAAPEATIALLDSALSKADASKAVVVYRRHFFYNAAAEAEAGTFASLTLEQQRALFEPGSTYRPGFFMSTSLDPGNIGMKEDGGPSFMVRLEIKTSRGAALPAVAQQGTGEAEVLLPRDGAYRVVSNDRWVTVEGEYETNRVPIIQLREL